MATIDRSVLQDEAMEWLPKEGNQLSQTLMDIILDRLITQIGDDDKNYAEVLCKYLRAIADANIGQAYGDPSGIKKEVLGEHEVTYGDTQSFTNAWEKFKDSLYNICPLFGYNLKGSMGGGIRINSGGTYNPLDR